LKNLEKIAIVWSDLRGFELREIEDILRYSGERYLDTTTHCKIVIGKTGDRLVMIPYEQKEDSMIPITIHATSRQQIKFRLKTGRFTHD
jgi:hypothetical protein